MLNAIEKFDSVEEFDAIKELEDAVTSNNLNAVLSALSKIGQDENEVKDLNRLFETACENDYAGIAALLIKDKRVEPHKFYSNGIILSVMNNRLSILELLLQDGRIDPTIKDNFATCLAIEQKSLEAVKLLLADLRIDPSFKNYHFIEAAIEENSAEIFEFLLPLSFLLKNFRPDSLSLLIQAMGSKNLEIIKKLISHELFDKKILKSGNFFLYTKNVNILECILKNSKLFDVSLFEIINATPETLLLEMSKYFQNPFSYLEKNKERFSYLQFESLKSAYGVDKDTLYIEQEYIDGILNQYLNYNGRREKEIINPTGNCQGWSFINQIYDENEFYSVLYYLNDFKALMEKIHAAILTELKEEYAGLISNPYASLEEYIAKFLPQKFEVEIKKLPLPENLKKFKNAYGLLETFISQVVFSQGVNMDEELKKKVFNRKYMPINKIIREPIIFRIDVADRSAQYEYVKNSCSNKQFKRLFSYSEFQLKKDTLEQVISFLSFWPDIKIDISLSSPLGDHIVSLSITSDGKLKYYDPNFPKKIEVNTISELITYITRDTFSFLGIKFDDNRSESFSFYVHKFYENDNVTAYETPKIGNECLKERPNPCKFNDLHFAIMRNDKSMVIELLNSKPKIDINSKDVFGNTPLMWAARMNNVEIFQELIINGANVNERNNQGMDAKFISLLEHSVECYKLLYPSAPHPGMKTFL